MRASVSQVQLTDTDGEGGKEGGGGLPISASPRRTARDQGEGGDMAARCEITRQNNKENISCALQGCVDTSLYVHSEVTGNVTCQDTGLAYARTELDMNTVDRS